MDGRAAPGNPGEHVSEAPVRVGVVTLNWDSSADTRRCLASLPQAASASISIVPVVVDNASSADDYARLVTELGSDVVLLRNKENRGFARATNQGIRELLQRDVDFIVLLNNDAVLHPGALDHAVAGLRSGGFAAVSGKIFEDHATGRLSYAGGRLNRALGRAVVPALGKRDGAAFSESGETRFVTCAYLVAPAETFRRNGLLPEDYFFGTEEWDFAMRLRRRGNRLGYIAESECTHPGAGTHRISRPR